MPSDDEWLDEEAGPVVRPYAVTGGRTRPIDSRLELVALVTTTPYGQSVAGGLEPEQRAIAHLCRGLQSIAEISAQLKLPLGVARVLVGDMADVGLVNIHRPSQPNDRPDVALLEKVLYGLHEL